MLPNAIFGIFHMYGIMIAVGILACFLFLFYYGKKRNLDSGFIDFVFYAAIGAIAFGFFTAALFQAVYNYIEDPEAGFKLFGGGITFIGGLIGGIVAFLALYFIFRKKLKGRVLDILSFAPCCITIAHAFGRIGCFCAGCCYGKATDSWLGVVFKAAGTPNYPVHPTQLYEAIFLFLLCAIIFLLVMKWDFKHGLSVYLITYGAFRFGIEYLRADDRGSFIGSISPSQFWSILMIVGGIAMIFVVQYLWKLRAKEDALKPKEETVVEGVESVEGAECVEGVEGEEPVAVCTETENTDGVAVSEERGTPQEEGAEK